MRRPFIAIIYIGSIVVSVGVFFLIRHLAQSLGTVSASGKSGIAGSAPQEPPGILLHVLLTLVIVIIAARVLGVLFRKLNQPDVIGEVVAGIALGPSFLGWVSPATASQVFPTNVAPYLAVISQVGVVIYMFLVGLSLDTDLLKQRTQSSVAISHASIIAPFLLGTMLALWLYPRYCMRNVSFTAFALFLGAAMSVTAFPVLARILTDRGIHKSRMGVLALTCAAVDDVTAWCLLAFVISVARAQPSDVLLALMLTVAFTFFVVFVARRGALWLVGKQAANGRTTREMFAIVCAAVLLAALTTERIGIHALFGAFLLGVVIPHDSALARDISSKCEDLVTVLLVPVFFAFTGLRTQIGRMHGERDWLACALIIAVASLGKFGGSFLAARWTGSPWREAASLGVLMNTRGLMELIILNVGLDLGVFSSALFTMFVIMAIVTTMATSPVLHILDQSQRVSATQEAIIRPRQQARAFDA